MPVAGGKIAPPKNSTIHKPNLNETRARSEAMRYFGFNGFKQPVMMKLLFLQDWPSQGVWGAGLVHPIPKRQGRISGCPKAPGQQGWPVGPPRRPQVYVSRRLRLRFTCYIHVLHVPLIIRLMQLMMEKSS